MTFKQDKITKNTIRFAEVGADGEPLDRETYVIGALYIQKRAFGDEPPELIKVEITEV